MGFISQCMPADRGRDTGQHAFDKRILPAVEPPANPVICAKWVGLALEMHGRRVVE